MTTDVRQQHTSDPRGAHGDSESRHDRSGVLQSVPTEAFAAYLVEERRACLQKAAAIERMLGMESVEAKLRRENQELRQKLQRR